MTGVAPELLILSPTPYPVDHVFDPTLLFNKSGFSDLNLKHVSISSTSNAQLYIFYWLLSVRSFKTFDYCRYATYVLKCMPKSDGISSIENLLDLIIHRVCIWLVAMVTCICNLLVFIGRMCVRKEEHQTHSFFIKNLCGEYFLIKYPSVVSYFDKTLVISFFVTVLILGHIHNVSHL